MSTSTLSPDDLRYLSMLAWRQGTRRAEDIADRIDRILTASQEPNEEDDSWIPPYARERPALARKNEDADAERARQGGG